ncbi:MAG: HD domain-containing phosphohydrolase [Nitrospirota bacterium]
MPKEKILVIDDEEIILQLSEDILTRSSYTVKTALDGSEGLRLLEKEKFDLIITDIKMPNIGGLDFIRQVRNGNKEIPIIILTGHGTLDIAINSLRLGAQGFILKPFTPMELRTAVAEAMEKTRLLNENIRMCALMPLFEVSKEIISEIDPKRLLRLIVETAVKETRADKSWVALSDEEKGELDLKEHHGLSSELIRDFHEVYKKTFTELVFKEKKPLVITPGKKLPPEIESIRIKEDSSFSVYVPLRVRGSILGLLSIFRKSSEHPFTTSEVEFVSVLGGLAAAAIENARLYEKLEKSYLSTIVTLSGVVEARDLYTDKHMKDIAEYSVGIARKLGLADTEIDNIRKAALLHDLGKVSVPDSILMKAGKLSEEEMDIIKKHPANGAKMIGPVEPLRQAREIIRHHQEYYDGSGYPDGLKGDDIPLGARIIAVADAFGAMTTDRPYRKALSIKEAINELKKCAGTQFDPDIVRIFISLLVENGTAQTSEWG